MAPPAKRRKKSVPAIAEITFDSSAREEYLTGFHKRKVQRIKHAQEEAARKERQERVIERKRVNKGISNVGILVLIRKHGRCEMNGRQTWKGTLRL